MQQNTSHYIRKYLSFPFFLLALLSSYLDNDYGIYRNSYYSHTEFMKYLNFCGNAPFQSRVLIFILTKPFLAVLKLENAFFVVKFILFYLFYVVSDNFLFHKMNASFKLLFYSTFPFIYANAMFGGWLPDTILLVLFTSLTIIINLEIQFKRNWVYYFVNILCVFLFSISRTDMAFLVLLLCLFYNKKSNFKYLLLVIPPVVQFILNYIFYGSFSSSGNADMLMKNLTLDVPKSPLIIFILFIITYKYNTVKEFIRFLVKDYRFFILLTTLYLLLCLKFARITEMRIYLPFYVIILYLFTLFQTKIKNKTNI